MTTPNVSNEIKATLRDLEDQRDVLQQLKIERELLRREVVSLKEQGSNELKHSLRLKKHLEAIEESNKLKREQLESVSSIRHDLKKGTIRKVLCFSEDQVEKYKRERNAKTATMHKKQQMKIDEYTKNRPLAIEYKKHEAEFSQISLAHDKLVEEVAVRTQEINAEKEFNKLWLEEKITEMAQHIQRYRSIDDKLKNPNKKAEKSAPSRLMAMMNQFRLKKAAQSSLASSQKEVPDKVMSETSSTSKYQETIHTNEASEAQAFDQGTVLRCGMKKGLETQENPRNEAVTKKPTPQMQDVSKAQPFIQKDVLADHKEKSASEKSESTDYSQKSQKSKKRKAVTFVDLESSGSGIEMNYSKEAQPFIQKDVLADHKEKSASEKSESTDYTQKSQKSKKRKAVTFVDLESSGSGIEMNYSKEGGFSSTNFKSAATNDMDMDFSLESEIQMNDSDEVHLEEDDGENSGVRSNESEFDSEFSSGMFRASGKDSQLKNPNKKAEKSAPSRLMAMMNQFRLKKAAQSSLASSQKEVPDKVMSETSSTSKYQETIHTNEASEAQAFDQGTVLRCGMKKGLETQENPRNEAVTKKPTPQMQDVSKAQPFIQKDVLADHKEKSASEKSESTDYSQKSQKSKKRKAVTFVDLESSGSGIEMNYSKEGGFSSTNFKSAATNDMDMDFSLESEIQMNDSDEVHLEEDDGENSGVRSNESEFDSEFSSGMFRASGKDSQPTNDCDFDMNFMDDQIEDMSSIFSK